MSLKRRKTSSDEDESSFFSSSSSSLDSSDPFPEVNNEEEEEGEAATNNLPLLLTVLPLELQWHLAQFLSADDIRSLAQVNHQCRCLAQDDSLWRVLYRRTWAAAPPAGRMTGVPSGENEIWRAAYRKRVRTVHWLHLLVQEREPESVVGDTLKRFNYFVELVFILAEHSSALKMVNLQQCNDAFFSPTGTTEDILCNLGDPLAFSLLSAGDKSNLPVMRLAWTALAYLLFRDQHLSKLLQERLNLNKLWQQQFSSNKNIGMAAAYLCAVYALKDTRPQRTIRIPSSVLLQETLEEEEEEEDDDDDDDDKMNKEEDGMEAEQGLSATQITELQRSLSGVWCGYYVYCGFVKDEPMHFSLTMDEYGNIIGAGTDKNGRYTLNGRVSLPTGYVSFDKCYTDRDQEWLYQGKINGTGIAGIWGTQQWGGSFIMWRDDGDEQQLQQAQKEQLSRSRHLDSQDTKSNLSCLLQ